MCRYTRPEMGNQNSRQHRPGDKDGVWRTRDYYLDMTVLEKRNQYPGNFVTLDAINPWPDYLIDNIAESERHRSTPFRPHDEINSKVSIWRGDITQLEIDAIVNSAARPERGGQVNTAIIEQAGDGFVKECLLNGLGNPGEAMLTGGYRLPARYILNTMAPRDKDVSTLRMCYTNCLNTAKTLSLTSLAFPCIATKKRRGFPINHATEVALETVREWMDKNHSVMERVVFCLFDSTSMSLYERLMQRYFPVRGHCNTPSMYIAAPVSEPQEDDSQQDKGNETGLTLEDWRDNKFQAEPYQITVSRADPEKFIKQLHGLYNSDINRLCREPVIRFEGEEGIDFGGMTNEFFFEALDRITHTAIQGSPLFEGPTDHMLPCPSRVHITLYNITGRILAHSILHYGIGICGLSRAIVYLLTHDIGRDDVETCGLPVTIDDIMDTELRTVMQKQHVDQLSSGDKATLREYMERCNVGYIPIDAGSFEGIKQELLMYEVIYRRWTQIEAIRNGMNDFGLHTFLCLNPSKENITEVFPRSADLKIVPHMILNKMTLVGAGGDGWEYFKNFLDDLSNGKMGGLTLNTLVLFWTGNPTLPSTLLTAEVDPVTTVPQASTCFHRLFIPGACGSYEKFFESFQMALTFGARGFGEM